MTKKRFIKLLMGKFRYPRNKARWFANKVVLWHEIDDTNNAIFKKLEIKSREMPSTYSGLYAWIQINELAKDFAESLVANNARGSGNSVRLLPTKGNKRRL